MHTGVISQRVSSVAPTFQSSTRPLGSASAPSYQSTTNFSAGTIKESNNTHDEEILLELIEECERVTRDFNVKVALYRETLRQLGDVGDGVIVRKETRKQRQKSMEAAKLASVALSPHIKSNVMEREEFDRLFVQLTGCMEHFAMEMRKGIFLIQKFPCDLFEESDISALPGMILSDSDSKISSSNVTSNCSNNSQTKHWLSTNRRERDQMKDTEITSTSSHHTHEVSGIVRDIREIETMLREITCTDLQIQDKYTDGTSSTISEIFQPSSNLNKFRRRLGSWCCLPTF